MATSTLPSPHSATVPTYLVLYSISRSGLRLHAIQTFHSSIKLLRTLVAVVALSSKTRALRSSHTPLMTCMTSEFAVHRIASGRAATASGPAVLERVLRSRHGDRHGQRPRHPTPNLPTEQRGDQWSQHPPDRGGRWCATGDHAAASGLPSNIDSAAEAMRGTEVSAAQTNSRC